MSTYSRNLLTVDIGNTAVKASIFEGEQLVHSVCGVGLDREAIEHLLDYNTISGVSFCCVGADPSGIAEHLGHAARVPVTILGPDTPLPISVRQGYRTTLGADRVAAAVGVATPGQDFLVVDAGTAVTADLVCGMHFEGGNISPGEELRFRSLHAFTSRLPMVSPLGETPAFGYNTETAIRAGVMRGIADEITGAYNRAKAEHPSLQLILTGGDANLLAPLLRENGLDPVEDHQAVGRGLVRIFNHNNPLTDNNPTHE